MTEAQCDQLLAMLEKHKWPYRCRRLNIVPPEFQGGQGARGDKRRSSRYCLTRTKSESFGKDNQANKPIYELVVSMLPEDFERGEHLCMTINHNVCCYPHKDANNVGRETLAMFLGEFEGGELVMETGEVYRGTRVWHRYDGARVTHWNTEHCGDKYSVIVHNNKTSLTWKNHDKRKIEKQKISFSDF
jgi:hypothetical protein